MYDRELMSVAQGVMEQAAFLTTDPAEIAPADAAVEGNLCAAMDFSGEFAGTIAMMVDESIASSLAANMLGLDEGDPLARLRNGDALGEILNMICGNLLPEIAGSGPVFNLGSPRPLTGGEYAALVGGFKGEKLTRLAFTVEERQAEIVMNIGD